MSEPEGGEQGIVPGDEIISHIDEQGYCLTDLRPLGRVEIAGQEVECMAEFPPIDRDSIVKVVAYNGNTPVVRKVE